ncbi:MAG: outer capsid protein Hoc [Nitrospira sp.]|nr:outer capsid protein Hoc [Nitrospira sp.]
MSDAIAAYGTLLKRGDGNTPETFTNIAEVKSISGPNMSSDVIDVTTHSSAAAGAWREKIASLIDPGELSFDINFIPDAAGHIALRTDFVNRTKRNFKIQFPNIAATTWTIEGIVTGFECEAPTDDVLAASITITITKAPTFS